jgi:hypothetical protein
MSHPFRSMLGVGATLVMLVGCNGTSDMIDQAAGQPQSVVSESEGIRLTLQTDKPEYDPGEPVVLTFEVKNMTNVSQSFNFSDGCQHDFVVDQDEGPVWSAGHERACIQALTSFELEPGEVWMRSDTWDQRTDKGEPVGSGAFDSTAVLPQTGKPLESDTLKIVIR